MASLVSILSGGEGEITVELIRIQKSMFARDLFHARSRGELTVVDDAGALSKSYRNKIVGSFASFNYCADALVWDGVNTVRVHVRCKAETVGSQFVARRLSFICHPTYLSSSSSVSYKHGLA